MVTPPPELVLPWKILLYPNREEILALLADDKLTISDEGEIIKDDELRKV